MSLGLNPGILSVGIGSVGGQGEFIGGIEVIDGSGIGHDIGAGFFGHEEGFGVRNGVVGDGVDRKGNGVVGDGVDRKRNGGGHGGHGGHGECIEVRGDDVKLGIAEVEGLEVGLTVGIVGGFTRGKVLGGQSVGVSGIHSCGHGKKQSQKES